MVLSNNTHISYILSEGHVLNGYLITPSWYHNTS